MTNKIENYPVQTASGFTGVGPQKQMFFRFMDEVGDGSGNTEANGNYAAPTDFKIKPEPGEVIRIARLILMVEDAGSFDSGFYGNGLVLVNGLKPYKFAGGQKNYIISGGQPAILTSGDVAAFCHDLDKRSWGSGNEFLTARWTLTKAGQYVRLVGNDDEEFGIELQDDYTGLVKHRFMVQGYYE